MAEVAAAAVGAVAVAIQAKTALWDPLKKKIDSSNDMDEIYRTLTGAVETLVALRKDYVTMIEYNKNTMMPSNLYKDWSNKVDMAIKDVETLDTRYPNEKKKSVHFKFISRSRFTKKMKTAALWVITLIKDHIDPSKILVDKKLARVVYMTTPTITNIPTLRELLEQTLDLLCNARVRGVGIYGIIGCGKRTIMQNLNNHAKVAEMFDIVIWVTVSRKGSMENIGMDQIQLAIVQRLKLNIETTTQLDLIAMRIREELNDVKYLLLLDDVKEDLNLDKIGIPIKEHDSKIVFTTEKHHVCSSIATIQINVPTLKKKEAQDMFENVLNRPTLLENPNIKRKIRQIVEWCGYHPLMIYVAAGVFRIKETEDSWHDGSEKLKMWPDEGDVPIIEMYKLLKSCFDFLPDMQKNCFFYSALYPEDSDIQKACLLDNWSAEELLGTDNDVKEMGSIGREILDSLKEVSLIEENPSQQSIRMHKLVRLAAIHCSPIDNNHGILVKCGEELKKPIDVELWKHKKWISLVDSKMHKLPDNPSCSTLSTLFLQKNPNLEVIPEAFFEDMGGLHVLDLYNTRIKSLPSSVLKLVTLKVLYLQKCVSLVTLPCDIGKLLALEVLDIRGSGLANIPPQVQNMTCLKRLLVSFPTLTSTTPTTDAHNDIKVISKLNRLRELVIDVQEELEGTLYGLIVNTLELTILSLLQFCSHKKVVDLIKVEGGNWKISFPTEELFQSYIYKFRSFNVENCQIFIGCDITSRAHTMEFMPYVKFHGKVSNNTISQILSNDVAIELVNHDELEHLSNFTAANINNIRCCVIKDCKKMRTLVDDNMGGTSILTNLDQLHMINLPVLNNTFKGLMQGLTSLKTLILCNCPMLTSVCTYGVILQLPAICHLEVEGCSGIKDLFNGSPNVVSPMLPNLQELILVDMPQLTSILVSNSFEWPALEKLKILGCPKLKRLPFQNDCAVNLNLIEAKISWWETLENDQEFKDRFGHYCHWI